MTGKLLLFHCFETAISNRLSCSKSFEHLSKNYSEEKPYWGTSCKLAAAEHTDGNLHETPQSLARSERDWIRTNHRQPVLRFLICSTSKRDQKVRFDTVGCFVPMKVVFLFNCSLCRPLYVVAQSDAVTERPDVVIDAPAAKLRPNHTAYVESFSLISHSFLPLILQWAFH